ncbi:MAG TPA: hypothetical protein VL728_16640 [Cyclobacteriaceae bacterium]|jgi:hypothetical protein|nr:hypothetical protein [Cyclobacteriaceae bacterium]
MSLFKALLIFFVVFFSADVYGQKQLLIMKKGTVRASFSEGEYIRFVLKKKHRHAEGHIVELYDFHMITSNDTVQFKDILKVNIKKHRGERAWASRVIGGLLMTGGLVYFGVDQGNVALNINAQNDTPFQWIAPLAVSGVGAAMLFIRPRYAKLNGIQYLRTADYRSPFYQVK